MQMTLKDAFARAFDAERRGDARTARSIYDDVLAAIPEHPGALLGIARHARAAHDYAAARDALDRAIASAKAMTLPAEELWVERALVEFAAGDRAAAHLRQRLGEPHRAAAAISDAHRLLAEFFSPESW